MISSQKTYKHVDQGIGSYIDYLNNMRLSELIKNLELILIRETDKLADLDIRKLKALTNLNLAKDEIDNLITTNRGGDIGIHGFIAEFAEAGIVNARQAFEGMRESVSIVNNNGPVDLRVGDHDVQMKFYANISDEIKQAAKYKEMKMMFPKDHLEVFDKIMNGEANVNFRGQPLSSNKINSIKQLIEQESITRNEPYHRWMESSVLNYDDVQKNKIGHVLLNENDSIVNKANSEQQDIKVTSDEKRSLAKQESGPNFAEANKAAGYAAAFQGGLNLAVYIYNSHKSGKEIWDFNSEDWKEAGLETGKGALKGGITGYSIYGLTNICQLKAPSAAAITSGTFGLLSATSQYRTGKIDEDEFTDLVILNSIDSTGAALGAALGQVVIPIPVVGAVIGSIAATTALGLGKGILNRNEIELINNYENKINNYVNKLDTLHAKNYATLMDKYAELGKLQHYAFDLNINIQLQFAGSIDLAQVAEVKDIEILHDLIEIDSYFLS